MTVDVDMVKVFSMADEALAKNASTLDEVVAKVPGLRRTLTRKMTG